MLSFYDAKKTILGIIEKPGYETINVRKSMGRILAQDIKTTFDFPDTKRSAVDGFAIIAGEKIAYNIINKTIQPGLIHDIILNKENAVEVTTGSAPPFNADAVVRIEDCTVNGNLLTINKNISKGENINNTAEEAEKGKIILTKGEKIKNSIYPVLFCAGVKDIIVYKRPKVGFFVTGNEILEVEDSYKKTKTFNTNRYILESFLGELGIDHEFYSNVSDTEELISSTIRKMSSQYDIIVSSGGISMGKYDFVKKIFMEQGFQIIVNKTAIKPGSPLIIAKKDNKLFFGMPGYPSAFLTNTLLYLVPAVKKAYGYLNYDHNFVNIKIGSRMISRKNRLDFNRANIKTINGELTAFNPGSQRTSHFLNFAQVNGLVQIDENTEQLNEGDVTKGLLFDMELI